MRILSLEAVLVLSLAACVAVSRADFVTIGASKDNTIHGVNTESNGAGDYFHTGQNGEDLSETLRALIAFDIATNVPAGSTITSVVLTLTASTPHNLSGTVNLHTLTNHWGEGTSHAPSGEAGGTSATSGDATWTHTFFSTSFWSNTGGDFVASIAASTVVPGNGARIWTSTQMVADVQSWLDNPGASYGWLLKRAPETGSGNAIRFNSRSYVINTNDRPQLTIGFAPPGADLMLFKTDAPDPVVGANALAYTLTVTNCGPGDARNVTITDTLPAGVTPAGPIVTNIGTLGPGAGASITIIVQVDTNTTGAITNQAVVSTSDTDPNPANDTAQADTTIPDFDSDGDPDFHDPDDDNDGIPDVFEENFGLDPNNAADAGLDPDMDGFTSLEEFVADTDPTNGISFFRIDKLGITNSVVIFFDSSTGRIYTLEFIDDPVNGFFTNFPEHTGIPGAGGADSFSDTNDVPRRFYRIEVDLP